MRKYTDFVLITAPFFRNSYVGSTNKEYRAFEFYYTFAPYYL